MYIVKIKEWNTMAKEFSVTSDLIRCEYGFSKEMEVHLPKDRIILVEKYKSMIEGTIPFCYLWEIGDSDHYSISLDMIEKIQEIDDRDIKTIDSWSELLEEYRKDLKDNQLFIVNQTIISRLMNLK
jgi:hypothetical protein